MRTRPALILTASAALVAAVVAAVHLRAVPLGVRGEWEWLRVLFAPSARDVTLAAVAVLAYAAFAALAQRALDRRASTFREVFAVLALLGASVAIQAVVPSGAPDGYGLAKWAIVLDDQGSTGYFHVARTEVRDLRAFLAAYPGWVRGRDALHIGTHPPGLIAVEAALLGWLRGSPGAARVVDDLTPASVGVAFRVYGGGTPLPRAERATVALTGMLTLVCCAATVVPLYALARSTLPAAPAFAAAALWPLVPSAVLFHPTADTAFPLLSTAALALAAAGRTAARPRPLASVACGVALGLGMQFTLAFLAVGLVAGLLLATAPNRGARGRALLVVATGAGFLGFTVLVWAVTGADPFVTWWWNLKNHARFYVEFPRSYLPWVVANPVELAIGLGLPASVWAAVALARPRGAPAAGLATALVLVGLTLSGKNLSEVARLWLPLMPPLLVAAGSAFERTRAGPASLAVTIILTGAQTLALQCMVQVVYPV